MTREHKRICSPFWNFGILVEIGKDSRTKYEQQSSLASGDKKGTDNGRKPVEMSHLVVGAIYD